MANQNDILCTKDFFNVLKLISRGDHIVPNFEEIWPSKKNEDKTQEGMTKGMKHVISAMSEGLAGNRDAVFTTVGKPKV